MSGALNGLGYMSHHHHLVLGHGNGPKVERPNSQKRCRSRLTPEQAVRDAIKVDLVQSEELKAALLMVPEKPYIGKSSLKLPHIPQVLTGCRLPRR